MPDNPEDELELLTDGPQGAAWTLILDRRRGSQLQAVQAIRPYLGAEPGPGGGGGRRLHRSSVSRESCFS